MLAVFLLSTTPVMVVPVPVTLQPTPDVDALVPVPLKAMVTPGVLVPTEVLSALLFAVMDVVVSASGFEFDVEDPPPPHPATADMTKDKSENLIGLGLQVPARLIEVSRCE
jgi:hypothetical protein